MRTSASPLRWDPTWPADKPITQHPDFDARHANDPDELALFREFGASPMGGSNGIMGALAYHPRWMLAPSDERRHEVLADFLADVAKADLEEVDVRVARVVARLLMRFTQVLRLVDVARLAGCTRLAAHRALWTLARKGLLMWIDLDPRFHPTHIALVHDGVARLFSLLERGDAWEAEMDAEVDAEEAADAEGA